MACDVQNGGQQTRSVRAQTLNRRNSMAPKSKDLPTKKDVKGGASKTKLATNDNLTLIRGAKPAD